MITYNEKLELYIHEDPSWPRFKELVAGVGWADPDGADTAAENWAVLLGLVEDGSVHIIEERYADIPRLCSMLTDLKDQYLIQRIFTDREKPQLLSLLWQHDGLTAYNSKGKNAMGREQYWHKHNYWPHFRDRDTKARLIPLVEDMTADVQAYVEILRQRLARKELTIRPACPQSIKLLRLLMGELIDHPIMRAIGYPLLVLDRESRRGTSDLPKPPPIYGNLRR
jgi:hypothetical protein